MLAKDVFFKMAQDIFFVRFQEKKATSMDQFPLSPSSGDPVQDLCHRMPLTLWPPAMEARRFFDRGVLFWGKLFRSMSLSDLELGHFDP